MRARFLPILVALGLIAASTFAWANLWAKPNDAEPVLGVDLGAYREAAIRLSATGSPYHDALVSGPIENQLDNVPIAYLYPPPLAQVFLPMVALDPHLFAYFWAAVQAVALLALVPVVFRRYGGTTNVTSMLALWLAMVLFYPLNVALYVGNLSGWIAIAVAIMLLGPGRSAGVASAFAGMAKMTPALLLIPAVIRRESRPATVLTVGGFTMVSVLISPYAWAEWFRVLPNIVRFPAASSTANLAPVSVLGSLGFPAVGVMLGLMIAAVAIVASIHFAVRGSWAGAVAAATMALLFAPSTIWDHYLVIALPILVAAWPKSDWRVRAPIVLFAGVGSVGWFGSISDPALRLCYLAATILATGLATAWLASRAPAPLAVEAVAG